MIRSRQNRRLKDIRRARQCKGDRAVLDGPHLLREALASRVPVEEVFATPEFMAAAQHRTLVEALGVEPILVAPEVLAAVADADSPRGVLAVIRLPRDASPPPAPDGIWLYLAGIQDPGNVGAIARVAEAAEVQGIALSPACAHPNHPRALRASAGSLLRMPLVRGLSSRAAMATGGLGGAAPWVALTPRDGEPLWRAVLEPPLVLALGAEGRGLPAEIEARVSRRITIPMARDVESLNVAVAAAVVLFECARRGASGD